MQNIKPNFNMKRIGIILFFASFFSCTNLELPLTNELNDVAYWRNDQDAIDALSSCYQSIMASWEGRSPTDPTRAPNYDQYFAAEALSDNAFNLGTSYGGVGQIANGSFNNLTPRIAFEWSDRYAGIRRCNKLLENVDKIKGSTAVLIARYKAEARFIRAWSLFQLTNFYGDVPLVTTTLTISDAKSISRTAKADVVAFILSELADIQTDLPVVNSAGDLGRINRAVAIALRARVNLYQGNWADVVADCEKLITSSANGAFGLHSSYPELFTVAAENSNEIIWALQMGGARLQSNQRLFLPPTVGELRSQLVPTQALVDDYIMTNGKAISEAASGYVEATPFLNRDPRLESTILHDGSTIIDFDGVTQTILTKEGSNPAINSITDGGASTTGYYFQKYYDRTSIVFASGVNLILLRYADVLLMYAEAKNELGQMNATVWDATIKPIRQRAGFTLATALNFDASLNQASMRSVIRRERRAELAFEGQRIFDIKRWAIAEQVLNQPAKGIKVSDQFRRDANGYRIVEDRTFTAPKNYLWPIPQFELDQNKNLLPNNNGW
jgi:starch-binding outer membrane protein, SusD/RagB family